MLLVRSENLDLVTDPRTADRAMAVDLFRIGREHLDEGNLVQARQVIRRSLRYRRGKNLFGNARAVVWVAVLSLPARARERIARALLDLRRAAYAFASRQRPSQS
jgi:hypothetical protein